MGFVDAKNVDYRGLKSLIGQKMELTAMTQSLPAFTNDYNSSTTYDLPASSNFSRIKNTSESPWASGYSDVHVVISSIVVICIIFGIIFGNILVIVAIIKDNNLRTVQNSFIASLAVADLLVGSLIMPFSLIYEVSGVWYFGSALCDIWLATDVLLSTASIWNLCLISLDRYWSVTRAIEYIRQRTAKRATIMIAIAWGASAIICLPPLVGWKQPHKHPDKCDLTGDAGYVLYSSMGSFWIPLVIIIVVYIKIYQAARRRARRSVKSLKTVYSKVETEVSETCVINNPSTVSRTEDNCSFIYRQQSDSPEISSQCNENTVSNVANNLLNKKQVSNQVNSEIEKNVLEQKTPNGETKPYTEHQLLQNANTMIKEKHYRPPIPSHLKTRDDSTNSQNKTAVSHSFDCNEHTGNDSSNSKSIEHVIASDQSKDVCEAESNSVNHLQSSSEWSQLPLYTVPEVASDDTQSSEEDKIVKCKESLGFDKTLKQHSFKRNPSTCTSVSRNSRTNSTKSCGRRKYSIWSWLSVNRKSSQRGSDVSDLLTTSDGSSIGGSLAYKESEIKKRRIAKAKEKRAIVVVGIIIAAFIICWFPFFMTYAISTTFDINIDKMTFAVFFWLGYCNSGLNPLIYTLFNRDFKQAFANLLCRQRSFTRASKCI